MTVFINHSLLMRGHLINSLSNKVDALLLCYFIKDSLTWCKFVPSPFGHNVRMGLLVSY